MDSIEYANTYNFLYSIKPCFLRKVNLRDSLKGQSVSTMLWDGVHGDHLYCVETPLSTVSVEV